MKGQISISLTWIFAIMAGIAVFAMLISFADQALEQSDFESGITELNSIDTQLTSIAKKRKTFTAFDTANVKLKNLCENSETSGLLLEGAQNLKPKPHQVMFSEETLEGDEFLAWTQDWILQSGVDRFLYLATPGDVFVIVKDDDGEWRSFFDDLPAGFSRGVVNYGDLTEYNRRGFDTYTFLFFDDLADQPFNTIGRNEIPIAGPGAEVKAVRFTEDDGHGTAEFWELRDAWTRVGPSGYVGYALKLGAAFSDSRAHYECNRDKAYRRLGYLARINHNRTEALIKELAEGEPACVVTGGSADVPAHCDECIQVLRDAGEQYGALMEAAASDTDVEGKIAEAAEELKSIEQDLKKGRACPTL